MEQNDQALALRDYLLVVKQQWRLIAVVTLVATVGGVAYFLFQTPRYQASSVLALERVRIAQDISLSELLDPVGAVSDTDLAVARSAEVADRAAAELGRDDSDLLRTRVSVAVRGSGNLEFSAIDTDPQLAAALANAFANAFVEARREQTLTAVAAAAVDLDARADELRAEIAAIDSDLAVLVPDASAGGDDSDNEDSQSAIEANPTPEVESLQLQRQALQSQLFQVIQRATELGTTTDALTGFEAGFTAAGVPTDPVGVDWVGAAGAAFTLGLALGLAAAFLRDRFHDLVRGEPDLKRATRGLPVLARVPTSRPARGAATSDSQRLASLLDPTSLPAEAYRELSAGIRFMLVAQAAEIEAGANSHFGLGHSRSVLVASADISEGKTTTAANLAVATARVGLRTVLVDADLRRSAVASRFGLPLMLGLSDALLNGDGPADYLVDVGVPRLRVLTAGTVPPNPTELLASPAMRASHRQLLELSDIVIYDSPAVLAVADTLELAPFVDLGILVGRVGSTTRRRLEAALERLEQVGMNISGTVLNGVSSETEGYYYTGYYSEASRQSSAETDPLAATSTTDEQPHRVVPSTEPRTTVTVVQQPADRTAVAETSQRDGEDEQDQWLFKNR